MVDKQELDEVKFKHLSTGLKTFVVLGWISIVFVLYFFLMTLLGLFITIMEGVA